MLVDDICCEVLEPLAPIALVLEVLGGNVGRSRCGWDLCKPLVPETLSDNTRSMPVSGYPEEPSVSVAVAIFPGDGLLILFAIVDGDCALLLNGPSLRSRA